MWRKSLIVQRWSCASTATCVTLVPSVMRFNSVPSGANLATMPTFEPSSVYATPPTQAFPWLSTFMSWGWKPTE
ncbi:hypothetical protein D3C72_2198240 [compost metagenome]